MTLFSFTSDQELSINKNIENLQTGVPNKVKTSLQVNYSCL